ncbi:MAG: hypothetical protein JST68_19280 [Bacteroidetes bacterium]|nr:hypothetical protein [Bacteroidota bacterium]
MIKTLHALLILLTSLSCLGQRDTVSTSTYKSFTLREKFDYNMNHKESFYQICSAIGFRPIQDSHELDLDYARLIVRLNAKKAIPALLNAYRHKPDNDIHTALLLLMSNAKYLPMTGLSFYQDLYLQSGRMDNAYINFKPEYALVIQKKALDFYSNK